MEINVHLKNKLTWNWTNISIARKHKATGIYFLKKNSNRLPLILFPFGVGGEYLNLTETNFSEH